MRPRIFPTVFLRTSPTLKSKLRIRSLSACLESTAIAIFCFSQGMEAQNLPSMLSAAFFAGVCTIVVGIGYLQFKASDNSLKKYKPEPHCSCIIKLGGSACTIKDSVRII